MSGDPAFENATLSRGSTASRIVFLVLILSIVFAQTSHSEGNEVATGADVVGQWVSEPSLGQLGWTQSRISFQKGGAYSHKLDMISFCDGRDRGIDCEYVWMIVEGNYMVEGNVVTVNIKTDKRVVLFTGQADPQITENSEYPRIQEIMAERQGSKLLIRKSPDDDVTVYEREN